MSRLPLVGVACATALATACPSPRDPAVPGGAGRATSLPSGDEVAMRTAIARAEARRGGGLDELLEAARKPGPARTLALRGLGRVGGARARATLRAALGEFAPEVVATAAAALGVMAALADEAPPAAQVELTNALVAAVARVPPGRLRAAVVEAIGRAGDPTTAMQALTAVLGAGGDDAVAAAFAFARFGRRKLAWHGHDAVIAASRATDPRLRYAATYALARESQPAHDDGVVAALAERTTDTEPEVRAVAIYGLGLRDVMAEHRAEVATVVQSSAIQAWLADPDWRVAVEAARALAGKHGNTDGRTAVVAAAIARLPAIDADPRQAQVVIEMLRTLTTVTPPRWVTDRLSTLDAQRLPRDPLARAWVVCLADDISARSKNDLGTMSSCSELPDAYRLPLVAELVKDGIGTLDARRAAVAPMLTAADPRVRGTGLGALATLYKESADADRDALAGTIATSLADNDLVVRASALDAADTLLGAMIDEADKSGAARRLRGLDAAVLARAPVEPDVEEAAQVLELAGNHHLTGATDACRAGLRRHPAIARAAATCLRSLGELHDDDVRAEPAAIELPPVDLAAVVGKHVRWTLETTRGQIAIELAPDVAPWGVAAIVALTQSGKHAGLDVHRVVPDFVAQGGDPTNSGTGGPPYMLPAEPASVLDGTGFVMGGVGLADGGPDSAGSQWFIMHSRAAHLDGRYTWVGAVVAGQNVVDSLLLGDRVVRATVTVE